MSQRLTFEGMDDVVKFLDKVPANLEDVTRKAMRKANAATAKRIRLGVPPRFVKMVTGRVVRARSTKELSATIGLFNKHTVQGHQSKTEGKEIFDWSKAYWKNYGTLEGRDPDHQFDQPVRHAGTAVAKRRRNRTGQRAEKFFESAIVGWDQIWFTAFQAEMAKLQDELYER